MLRRSNHKIIWTLWITVALTLVGCNRKTIYSHYESTPLNGWEPNDRLSYSIGPIRESGLFSESVGLRTTSDYPFLGLTLIVEQEVFPVYRSFSDTLSASLIDREGFIKGKGVSTFQYSFQLRRLFLNEGDSVHVVIHHVMKREQLPGISDVGFLVERVPTGINAQKDE